MRVGLGWEDERGRMLRGGFCGTKRILTSIHVLAPSLRSKIEYVYIAVSVKSNITGESWLTEMDGIGCGIQNQVS